MVNASASRLNDQLTRAFNCIFECKLGAEAELTEGEHTFGYGKVQNKWTLYFIRAGEQVALSEASLVIRAVVAHRLMDLWHAVQVAHEAKDGWIIEAADAASEFCEYMEEDRDNDDDPSV